MVPPAIDVKGPFYMFAPPPQPEDPASTNPAGSKEPGHSAKPTSTDVSLEDVTILKIPEPDGRQETLLKDDIFDDPDCPLRKTLRGQLTEKHGALLSSEPRTDSQGVTVLIATRGYVALYKDDYFYPEIERQGNALLEVNFEDFGLSETTLVHACFTNSDPDYRDQLLMGFDNGRGLLMIGENEFVPFSVEGKILSLAPLEGDTFVVAVEKDGLAHFERRSLQKPDEVLNASKPFPAIAVKFEKEAGQDTIIALIESDKDENEKPYRRVVIEREDWEGDFTGKHNLRTKKLLAAAISKSGLRALSRSHNGSSSIELSDQSNNNIDDTSIEDKVITALRFTEDGKYLIAGVVGPGLQIYKVESGGLEFFKEISFERLKRSETKSPVLSIRVTPKMVPGQSQFFVTTPYGVRVQSSGVKYADPNEDPIYFPA